MRGPKPRPKAAKKKTPTLTPPSWMRKEAKDEWKRIVALLTKQKVTSELDLSALTIYATSVADYRRAQEEVDKDGLVVVDLTGTKAMKNPWCLVLKECAERIRPLLAEFGLTPTARARLKLDHDPDDSDNGELVF